MGGAHRALDQPDHLVGAVRRGDQTQMQHASP
jgi:hypothetical protein